MPVTGMTRRRCCCFMSEPLQRAAGNCTLAVVDKGDEILDCALCIRTLRVNIAEQKQKQRSNRIHVYNTILLDLF